VFSPSLFLNYLSLHTNRLKFPSLFLDFGGCSYIFLIVVQPCVIAPWWYLTVNPLCVFQLGTYSLRNKNAKFHSLLGNLSPWVWNTLYICAQGTSCFPLSTQACITNMSASEFLIFLHKNSTRGVLWVRVLIRKQSSSIDPLTCLSSDVKNDCPLAPWQRPTRTCGQSCSKCLTHQLRVRNKTDRSYTYFTNSKIRFAGNCHFCNCSRTK
jgi:hypothetical protein